MYERVGSGSGSGSVSGSGSGSGFDIYLKGEGRGFIEVRLWSVLDGGFNAQSSYTGYEMHAQQQIRYFNLL